MNIGEKAFVFALGALFVVGVAAVATSAAGAPDGADDAERIETDEAESIDVEIAETNGENGTFKPGEVTFEVNQSAGSDETPVPEDIGDRVDRYDGTADYYHVPVGAVDDDEYDHDFEPSEVAPSTEFAGATGYVVEAEKVDTDDPSVVAHVAENDPGIDEIAHAEDMETRELDVDDKECRENDDGNRVCELSLDDGTEASK
ncbi:MAG: hypothetical protein ACLFR5_03230 [Halobacteriales archaeon]